MLEVLSRILKNHDSNFTGIQFIYHVDGPGNWICFFWTTGSMYVACLERVDGIEIGQEPFRIAWCNPA